jgi:light-harvesting complex 1 beta chain
MANDELYSPSGLTDKQAQEVNKFFITGFTVLTLISTVAHILVWMWRPWIPGKNGYTTMLDISQTITQTFLT